MKYDVVFFSPHLDDAILSAGGKMLDLIQQGKKVCVITVFTNFRSRYTSRASQHHLQLSSETRIRNFRRTRLLENLHACALIRAECVHFNFFDGAFRTAPFTKNSFLYPDYKQIYGGKINCEDLNMLKQLKKLIHIFCIHKTKKTTHFFGPLGVGNHIDHLLVFTALLELQIPYLSLWEDVPYHWDNEQTLSRVTDLTALYGPLHHTEINISKYSQLKSKTIGCYKSQLAGLRSSGLTSLDLLTENFYKIKRNNI